MAFPLKLPTYSVELSSSHDLESDAVRSITASFNGFAALASPRFLACLGDPGQGKGTENGHAVSNGHIAEAKPATATPPPEAPERSAAPSTASYSL